MVGGPYLSVVPHQFNMTFATFQWDYIPAWACITPHTSKGSLSIQNRMFFGHSATFGFYLQIFFSKTLENKHCNIKSTLMFFGLALYVIISGKILENNVQKSCRHKLIFASKKSFFPSVNKYGGHIWAKEWQQVTPLTPENALWKTYRNWKIMGVRRNQLFTWSARYRYMAVWKLKFLWERFSHCIYSFCSIELTKSWNT